MATRPLMRLGFDELRRMFEAGRNDHAVLQELAAELEHRSTQAARVLHTEVAASLRTRPQRKARTEATPALCLDFGTSSLRAAWRESADDQASPLSIGAVRGSQIDEASIPSALFLPSSESTVYVGQEALVRGLRGESSRLFEASPKRWISLGNLDDLRRPACEGSSVTRFELLAALIAHALGAACHAAGLPLDALEFMDIRIAHPVWPAGRKAKADMAMADILSVARSIADEMSDQVPADVLARLCRTAAGVGTLPSIDVVEPIAAAIELFSNAPNSRECCAVVDVGAGTIDLGLLISRTPDQAASRAGRSLIPLCDPRSIYSAGDAIDDALVRMICTHAPVELSKPQTADLQRRKRALKEQLFRDGRLVQFGARVTLEEFEEQPAIRGMAEALESEFRSLVLSAAGMLAQYASTMQWPIDQISVVFAGGGGEIDFLRDAIPNRVPIGGGLHLPVKARRPRVRSRNAMPATVGRLAVSLGGTATKAGWPMSEMAANVRMYGLSGVPGSR